VKTRDIRAQRLWTYWCGSRGTKVMIPWSLCFHASSCANVDVVQVMCCSDSSWRCHSGQASSYNLGIAPRSQLCTPNTMTRQRPLSKRTVADDAEAKSFHFDTPDWKSIWCFTRPSITNTHHCASFLQHFTRRTSYFSHWHSRLQPSPTESGQHPQTQHVDACRSSAFEEAVEDTCGSAT